MRRLLALGAAAMLAVPAPAFAETEPALEQDEAISAMTERLRDPATQEQVAGVVNALSQVLLDMKTAPFAEAMAQATGEEAPDIDPDQTVRDIAPQADELPGVIERELPRAMDRMAGMGDALQTLLPALQDIAAQFKQAIDDSAISVR